LSDPISPYEMLEPEGHLRTDPSTRPERADRQPHEPSVLRALLRGLAKRCPRCGERDLFVHWLRIRDRCPRCRLRLEREEGGFLGAMTINYSATTLTWVAFLVIWLLVDLPGVRVAPLTVASVVLVGLLPLVFYPVSKMLWAAVDYLVFRSSPDYASADPADRAPGNGGRY
jgi:uncharacterized protein (DUF983 family)